MNILFVLYGDFTSNSANPLALYARELRTLGHACAVAVPSGLETVSHHKDPAFRPILYQDVLTAPKNVFRDGRPADVIHACTPREVVRKFVTDYLATQPTPLVIFLEDNEQWIALKALGIQEESLPCQTDFNLAQQLPNDLSHPFRYDSFIGLADAVGVIQDKLKSEVPPWVPCETVMLGVDLEFFSPRLPDLDAARKYGVGKGERVIVYHGGLNGFTGPAIETLCKAVVLVNEQGVPCRLLRAGPFALEFLKQFPPGAASMISDLGVLPRADLPDLLALADVFVQPGHIDPFEDLRLPGKIPEFLAMGRPVILPDANIAHLFQDGIDAVLLRRGTAEEIAEKCIALFADRQKADAIGRAGRRLAEEYFDVSKQVRRLEDVYRTACDRFSSEIALEVWRDTDELVPVPFRLARKLERIVNGGDKKLTQREKDLMQVHAQCIRSLHKRLGHLEQRISAQVAIATRERMIAKRDAVIHALRSSAWWRITTPLRVVKSLFTKWSGFSKSRKIPAQSSRMVWSVLRRIWRPALGLSEAGVLLWRRNGGIVCLLTKAYVVIKREGVGGLQRRLVAYTSTTHYAEWLRRYDTLTDERRAAIRVRVNGLVYKPLISVIMPTYNPEPKWLIEAIDSVRKQLYPSWELCIADDGSTDPRVRPILERYAASDTRIKVVFRKSNGHISMASNSALEMVTGEYIALLDHDDVLPEHALYWVAEEICHHPAASLIYSDEDKIDTSGRRFDPYFKCDWNVDLFYSHNLVSHLGVYRTELVRAVGGFHVGYEGAQDYDLALRCIEHIEPNAIVHIPHILYHWRMHPGSTATKGAAKPYASGAGQRAINEHLRRRGVAGDVQLLAHLGMYRVRYELPDPLPMVSLIILMRNGLELIRKGVTSILEKTTYRNFEILILDNGSADPKAQAYLDSLKGDARIRVIRKNQSLHVSALNNAAVEQSRGDVVGLMNNDIEVISPDWLSEMVSHALRSEIGAVGARLIYPNGTLQHAGVILGIGGVAGHAHKSFAADLNGYFCRAKLIQSFSAVTAACLVIRKELYVKVGGFDEDLNVAFNDIDFCLRVREAGYRNIYTPYAELYHHESANRGDDDDTPEKRLRFEQEVHVMKQRWGELLVNDPAYSPNLTLERHDFSFAWPPRVKQLVDLTQVPYSAALPCESR